MALEEIFVTGATGFMKKLVHTAAKKIGRAGAVDKDLQKLKDTLEMIAAVTSDAEKKQLKEKSVQLWLRRLQDVAYDIDDLLDEISYEAMRQSQEDGNADKVTILSTIKLSLTMADRIKAINKDLDVIAEDKVRFQLEPSFDDDQNVDLLDRKTFSVVDDSKIVGREKDKFCILEMLFMTNLEKVSVVSIVGMGGLGKTTLAQMVYKDNSIKRSFEPRAWVCISEEFDVFLILRNILESITQKKCDDFSNVDVLVKEVQKQISGRKYLIVLDDLWNENAEDWEKLKGCLSGGAQGSKILVTTRKQSVASIVRGTIPPCNLTTLSAKKCWSIIKNKAFSPGGAVETLTMSSIGEEIARKCAGLPLAANFLGGLMRLKTKESDWLAIKENEVFNTPENPNKILLILKLSYDNLSSHLKKCFSYCSLFPKDYKFDRETLIRLWMAEGFLHTSNGRNKNSLEDIGNNYFLSLLSSSFFQDLKKDDLGDIKSFKMHGLVHDLALSVVGSHEVMIFKASEMENDFSRVRRMQLTLNEGAPETLSDHVLKNSKKLRTIIFQDEDFFYPSALSNKRLRILHRLRDGYFRKTIPMSSSSFQIKHMRYLDLSDSNLEKVHAVSINQLYHLQTLNLSRSKNAQNILKGIGSLINLRYLDIGNCHDISILPTNIGCLQNLSSLSISCSGITELPDSISLINNLRHLNLSLTKVKVLPDSISRLTNLKSLDIRGCRGISLLPSNMCCLQNLASLNIKGTNITKLPDSICNIRNLKKLNLNSLPALPHNFGDLTQIRSLNLKGTGIRELPESLTSNLCKLEKVKFGGQCKFPKDIKNWVELKKLTYDGRTNGVRMPRGIENLTCLEKLVPYIVSNEKDICNNSSSSIRELADLNSLRKIQILNLKKVRGGKTEAQMAKLKDKVNIQDLVLRWEYDDLNLQLSCKSKEVKEEEEEEEEEVEEDEEEDESAAAATSTMVLEGLQPHPNLEILCILYFPGLKPPKWMGSSSCLPNLVDLTLKGCNNCRNLEALGQLPCLEQLYISGMDSVKCLGKEFYYQQEKDEEGKKGGAASTLFPLLTKFTIEDMESLEEWVAPHNSFPCIDCLNIFHCGNFTSIPDLRLWSSLRKLTIYRCNKLVESIPYDLRESLTFLKYLTVDNFRLMVDESKVSMRLREVAVNIKRIQENPKRRSNSKVNCWEEITKTGIDWIKVFRMCD